MTLSLDAEVRISAPLPARRWDYAPATVRDQCEMEGDTNQTERIAAYAALEWSYDKDAADWARADLNLSEEQFQRLLQSLARRNAEIWGEHADGGAARLLDPAQDAE